MSPLPMCPGCRALLQGGEDVCPYCGWNVLQTEVRREGGVVERALRPLGGVIPVLLFVNVAVMVVAGVAQARLLAPPAAEGPGVGDLFGAILNPGTKTLVVLGANVPRWVAEEGHVHRLLACAFLHGGVMHILFNMMALRNIGVAVEEAYGAGKALALYLLAAVAGSLGTVAWWAFLSSGAPRPLRDVPSVGASGAILGYAGILMALGFRIGGERGKALWKPLAKGVGFILVLGIALAFTRSALQIDNAAHIGGFLFGLGAGTACTFGIRARGNPTAVKAWDAAAIVLVLLTLASFVPAALALRPR